jgi:excinuclease ABC subunit C
MVLSSVKNKLKKLPQNPGIYQFYDKNGQILYIGKATNLRSRVGSYFIPSPQPSPEGRGGYLRPIEAMIGNVADIKVQKTDSVLEALILESNLIKKHQPKYNVLEKDDKSFSYFIITKEEFPRVIIMRKTEINKNPKSKIQITNKIPNPKSQNYKNIRNSKLEISNSHIYGPYTSKKQMEIALKIIRKIFPFHSNAQKTEKGCLDFQLGRCPGPYAGAISKKDYQKNIRGIRMILEGKKKGLVKKMEKEMKECAKKHEFEKAGDLRNKMFALQHIHDIALISKEELPHPPFGHLLPKGEVIAEKAIRIEAYDISNISGDYAVGSMIVFQNNEPDKSQYRKFKIKTIVGADDVGMMREVLLRRFKNDWPMPDLILLDGGQGHLNMAQKLLLELGLDIPLVAVAKGKTRKNLELRITNYELGDRIKNILKDKNLVKQIMDEAHRFAIGYHRKLRSKSLRTTNLY